MHRLDQRSTPQSIKGPLSLSRLSPPRPAPPGPRRREGTKYRIHLHTTTNHTFRVCSPGYRGPAPWCLVLAGLALARLQGRSKMKLCPNLHVNYRMRPTNTHVAEETTKHAAELSRKSNQTHENKTMQKKKKRALDYVRTSSLHTNEKYRIKHEEKKTGADQKPASGN